MNAPIALAGFAASQSTQASQGARGRLHHARGLSSDAAAAQAGSTQDPNPIFGAILNALTATGVHLSGNATASSDAGASAISSTSGGASRLGFPDLSSDASSASLHPKEAFNHLIHDLFHAGKDAALGVGSAAGYSAGADLAHGVQTLLSKLQDSAAFNLSPDADPSGNSAIPRLAADLSKIPSDFANLAASLGALGSSKSAVASPADLQAFLKSLQAHFAQADANLSPVGSLFSVKA
jgi:hypothetical protein